MVVSEVRIGWGLWISAQSVQLINICSSRSMENKVHTVEKSDAKIEMSYNNILLLEYYY